MSFALDDLGALLKAFGLFTLFLVLPGYVTGELSGICSFRGGSWLRKLALSVALSVCVAPICCYWIFRFLSIHWIWWFSAAIAFLSLLFIGRSLIRRDSSAADLWKCLCGGLALVVWLIIGGMSLPELRLDHRLYLSVTNRDYLTRVPITAQIARQEKLPAHTPFLAVDPPAQLRYHYFWPMMCGIVTAAGRFEARDATRAGTLWAGVALVCCVTLYLGIFQPEGRHLSWKSYALGIALLGVTGLDILPVLQWDLAHLHSPSMMYPTVEWWNEQVGGWLDSMLWVPHHIASLVASLMAFLILWCDSRGESDRPQAIAVVLAGSALASSAGLSIYVAFTLVCCLLVWTALMYRRGSRRVLLAVAGAGVIAALLVVPLFLELNGAPSSGDRVIRLTVREFWWMKDTFAPLDLAGGAGVRLKSTFFRLLFLPLNYFLELGVYFYAGFLTIRRLRKSHLQDRDVAAMAILWTCIGIATFLRSQAGNAGNDLGWRAFLPAQFILLLWTVDLFHFGEPLSRGQRAAIGVLLAIGVATTLFDLILLRAFPIFEDSHLYNRLAGTPGPSGRIGERGAAMAETYRWIHGHTGINAVVQSNPGRRTYWSGIFGDRKTLDAALDCAGFSGRVAECRTIQIELLPLFSLHGPPNSFAAICGKYPIDLLIVDDTDGVWNMSGSWMDVTRPVYSTPYSRVYSCKP